LGDVKTPYCSNIVLNGLFYGCGLRCVWKPKVLQDLDFDRKQLKVVQGKGKDRYVPLNMIWG
jgi:site-specific recombinase XerC